MPRTAPTSACRSIPALQATNFFLADVQTGLGPFVAAYLASSGWHADHVGYALTLAALTSVVLQTPAGGLIDRIPAKRTILLIGALVLSAGALLLFLSSAPYFVFAAQLIIGAANPFLAPTLAAITMGLVGPALFDRQFGRNQSFNSAGNVACALSIIFIAHRFGNRFIFLFAAALALPTIASVLCIHPTEIDPKLARGFNREEDPSPDHHLSHLLRDHVLVVFLLCAFLFHLANAAMLPQLGELLAKDSPQRAASFMSACIIVTQVVITLSAASLGKLANRCGRKPLLLAGFAVLPLRGLLYTVLHAASALIAVQIFDGMANAIWVVVATLVIADRSRGSGHFNLAQGALATAVGLGAALSTTLGGHLIAHFSYRTSFLTLGAIALAATLILLLFVPETRHPHQST